MLVSALLVPFLLSLMRRPPSSPLFPYTTLFRSQISWRIRSGGEHAALQDQDQDSGSGAIVQVRRPAAGTDAAPVRSEEHTSELQSRGHLVCRLLLEKKKK